MTDKNLYEHIRRLVKQQKVQQKLDTKQQNFAQEYCRSQMLKKKQSRCQQNRMNNLLKNFKNVQSYINIMDIIKHLELNLSKNQSQVNKVQDKQQLPEIIPKSLQLKIKEELAPILNKRYEEDSQHRQQYINSLKQNITCSNNDFLRENNSIQELLRALENNKLTEKLELIDVLRKDIKLKQIYFIEKRFDKEMEDISKIPQKIQNTKLFHRICSYLHMILQQQHKQKWASKKEQRFKQQHKKINCRKKMRIPTAIRNYSNSILKRHTSSLSKFQSSFINDFPNQTNRSSINGCQKENSMNKTKHQRFYDDNDSQIDQVSQQYIVHPKKQQFKKVQSKQELVKQTFTFRKRGIKAGIMSKINGFVDNLNDQQKKNVEVSKKYCKAFQSLSQQIATSYGRFKRQQLAQYQDIQDMKKYLDNTLSRNKKDIKKFHHHK